MDREASPSLRERKRLETITRVQTAAVDLFEERGFDNVTVEEIAAAAGVSASTVYRHFTTKERIVLHDEYDTRVLQLVPRLLAEHDLMATVRLALRTIGVDHFGPGLELTLRRTRLWFEVPSIRATGHLVMDEYSDWLAEELVRAPHLSYSPVQAQMLAGAVVGGLVAVIRAWHESGGGNLIQLIEEGLEAFTPPGSPDSLPG